MTEYVPASSVEAEQSLLGACFLEGISPPCTTDAFYLQAHRNIAEVMQKLELEGMTVDLPLVYERLNTCGKIEESGGVQYLTQLLERVGTSANLERYAEIVRQYAVLRRAEHAAQAFLGTSKNGNGSSPIEKVAAFAAEVLMLSDTGRMDAKEIELKESVKRALARIEDRMENGSQLVGIPTGIRHLDRLTGGMEPGKLIVIAARPSMGKTALALNIARNASRLSGSKGLIFSLEMPESSLVNRILAIESRIASDKIRSGQLTNQECSQVMIAAVAAANLDITIFDHPCTELEIMRKTRKIRPDYVVIDYLTLVRPANPTGKANYDVGAISTAMKHLSQELKIPVILLSQLNREIEKDKRKPRLSDLRDSGQVEQDADWIIFIHQKDGDHQRQDRELTLAKQRDGDCGFWHMEFLREFQILQSMEA